ncbi:MAG: LPS assembly protein LptD [Pseudomonadota bacterium]
MRRHHVLRPLVLAAAAAALLHTAPWTGASAQTADDERILLEAESLAYDQTADLITAEGSVYFSRGLTTLTADQVVYDRQTRLVTAIGNVVLVDEEGQTYFAERLQLDDAMAKGFAESVASRLADSSLIVASRGDREDENRTVFRDVSYTPCQVCAEDDDPTWRLEADTVVHDQEDETVRYQNATLRLGDVPVFYTPYLQHPDPRVDRQSGFLTPTAGYNDDLGFAVETPYYVVLAPNRDLTIRPTFLTNEPPVLALDFRDLQTFGATRATVSGTYASFTDSDTEITDDRFRGHIDAGGRYVLPRGWVTGFDLRAASDKSYLRRYRITDDNVLNSRLFAERYRNDSFVDVSTLGFQGLRTTDVQREIPIALPRLSSSFSGRVDAIGGRWRLRPNLLGLYRSDGVDSGRGSIEAALEIPRISPYGDVFKAEVSLRGDLYVTDGDVQTGSRQGGTQTEARLLPAGLLEWRRPYARTPMDPLGVTYTIEPIASLYLSPTGLNDPNIPNDDSTSFEFDETNLLRANRFTGIDLWDEGSRINYGLRTAANGFDRDLWSVFVGQSYRFSQTDFFEDFSGLENDASDVVGRVALSPHPWIDVDYRFRVGSDFGSLPKSDLRLVGGPPRVRVALGHLLLDEEESGTTTFGRREEGRAAISLQLTDRWSAIAGTRRDLEGGEPIFETYGLVYEDDCFRFVFGVERDFTDSGDANAGTTVAFRVSLKNLGEFGLADIGPASFGANDGDS